MDTSADRPDAHRYFAFISYKHHPIDSKVALWLHTSLEDYRVPAELARQLRREDARLGRVFRDKEELQASPDLSADIEAALEASEHLIVICSPRSARSEYVEREIRHFRDLGRGDRILALLIEGEPAEAFPAALRELSGADAGEFGRQLEPLAADLRPQANESDRAVRHTSKLRIISRMIGVAYDELFQRQRAKDRRRRRNILAAAAAAVLVFGVVVGWGIQESRVRRMEQLAKSRLLQDAALDQARLGDQGVSAVLLTYALREGEKVDRRVASRMRMAVSLAKDQLLPLRRILPISGQARGCAIAPNGGMAVVGGTDGRVWQLDLTNDQFLRPPIVLGDNPVRDSVSTVAFSRDGALFVVGTDGGIVYVFRAADGAEVTRFQHCGRIGSVALNADSTVALVAGRLGGLKSCDCEPTALATYAVATGELEQTLPVDADLYVAAFSPDNRFVAAAGGTEPENRLLVWDRRRLTEGPTALPQDCRVFCLSFHPTEPGILVAGDVVGNVNFWDVQSATRLGAPLHHDKQVRVVSFSEDGELLLVAGEDGVARVWNRHSRRAVGQRLLHFDQIRAGAISTSAGKIVTACFARDIRIWSLPADNLAARELQHRSVVWDAVFDARGENVLAACPSGGGASGGAYLWSLKRGGHKLLPHSADVMAAVFLPGGRNWIATGDNDGNVRIWDAESGREVQPPLKHEGGLVFTIAVDASGERLAFAGQNGAIRYCEYDPRERRFVVKAALQKEVYSFVWRLGFSTDGKRLAADGGRGLAVWQTTELTAPPTNLTPPNAALEKMEVRWDGRWEEDGLLLARVEPFGRLFAWNTNTPSSSPIEFSLGGESRNGPHGAGLSNLARSAKRSLVASGGKDGRVLLWSDSGELLRQAPLVHSSSVEVLRLSPDGKWLAVGCRDGSVRLWSVDGAAWQGKSWFHDGPVTQIRFCDDGKQVLSAGRDGVVRVVDFTKSEHAPAEALIDAVEAAAGITVALNSASNSSAFAAPRPLTLAEFLERAERRGDD